MRALRRLCARFFNFTANRRGDERLREEMKEHLTLQTEEYIRAGMSPQEAHRQAYLKFGAVEAVREDIHAEEGLPWIESVLQDCRYAFRGLRKSSGFTITAVLTLALGIGGNVTVFLVLYGVLLKPLPFPKSQQLVRIERSYSGGITVPAYSGTKALFFRQASHAFSAMTAYDFIPSHTNLVKGDGAVPISVLRVTSDFFRVFDMEPAMGRGFRPEDMRPGAPAVVVLSDALWRHQFGGASKNQQFAQRYFPNENPIGQHILIGKFMGPGFEDPVREIVGVVANVKQTGLDQPAPGIMYLPAAQIPDLETRMMNGLLGESWVVRTQSAHLDVLPAIRRIFMENAHAPLLSVEPMNEVISASVAQQRFSMILLCGFGLISLVLGAAGLYGVMSYNVARQTREFGVRMALGARREDMAGMVLKDAGVLVGIGLAIGIAASLLGAKIIGSLLFGVKPRDPVTLAAASVLLLLTGLFAAWWPARRAARVEPMEALRNE
jgi:MacB-like periplasmic core domain/FtsX-like permease family